MLLLCYVAHTEDAKHYTAPVTFFNDQLIPLLGLSGERHLIALRRRAIDAGWLYYTPGRKGIAGRYWVMIPPQHENHDDLPTDEDGDADFRVDSGRDSLAEREGKGVVKGKGKGLSFNPNPNPKEETPLPPSGGTVSISFPKQLDTDAFRQAWADLAAYRREQHWRPWKPRTIIAKLSEMATWGHDAAIEAIRKTIANGWQGVFPPKNQPSVNGKPEASPDKDEIIKRVLEQRARNATRGQTI